MQTLYNETCSDTLGKVLSSISNVELRKRSGSYLGTVGVLRHQAVGQKVRRTTPQTKDL